MTPDPSLPTRIIEPNAPDAAGPPLPTPAHVCPECTLAGDEALAKSTAKKLAQIPAQQVHKSAKDTDPKPKS